MLTRALYSTCISRLRARPSSLFDIGSRVSVATVTMVPSRRASSFPFRQRRQDQSLKRTHTGSLVPGPEILARNTFKYKPLSGDSSIRILTLDAGVRGDPLVAHLAEEELGDLEAPYEAVSYVWGTGARCAELRCRDAADGDETILPLTESIDDALQRLRLPDRPRRLWADQICINQADVAERSQQVRLMNAIYKGAQRVLVWLGRDPEGVAPEAVRMVRYLHGVFQDEEAHKEFRKRHSEELVSQSQEPWVPLSKLTKLPWFTRIWIVQEIGTATPATLFWGDAEVDWDELSSVATVLNVNYHYLRTRFHVFTPGIGYLYRRFVEPELEPKDDTDAPEGEADAEGEVHRGSFIYELHRARHLSSKDPRDHVYAFLGHFSLHESSTDGAGDSLVGIEPDYSRSVPDVYTDVAVRALTGASSLILLSACHTVQSPNRAARTFRRKISLPSWVPDWRILPLHVISSPDCPHRACGEHTLPKLDIDRRSKLLHITGVRVDTVSGGWTPFHGYSFHMRTGRHRSPSPSRSTPPLQGLWTETCGKTSFTLEETYVDGQTPAFFALMHTLTNACIGAERARRHADVPETDWLANGAAYLVSSTADAGPEVSISPELRTLAERGTPYKWSHEATLVARYRRFGVTERGYYLLGPDVMQQGDVVAVLYGGKVPFVLRPEGGRWKLLGECYMHGMMSGEAFGMGAEEEVFTIS